MVEMTENSVISLYLDISLTENIRLKSGYIEKIIFNKMCSKSTAILRNAHAPALKRMEEFRKAQAEVEQKKEKPMSQKMFKVV